MYNELTLRYFESAPGAGVLSGADAFRGAAGSRESGTWVQFDLQLSSGTIQAARFQAFGCPHTIAVAAWVVEQAVGRDLRKALPETVEELCQRFAVPIEKRGRLLVIEDAWAAAAVAAPPAARPAAGAIESRGSRPHIPRSEPRRHEVMPKKRALVPCAWG